MNFDNTDPNDFASPLNRPETPGSKRKRTNRRSGSKTRIPMRDQLTMGPLAKYKYYSKFLKMRQCF